MHLPSVALLVPLFTAIASSAPVEELQTRGRGGCSFAAKKAGMQYEIDTIGSHTFADANQIPLSADATRTFLVTPTELHGVTLPPINVGVTAETVRAELVGLATVLNAGVPPNSVHYINNRNGSATVDFIQTDQFVLPHVNVREIHYFNDQCQITEILGYVHGNIICPDGVTSGLLNNPVVTAICAAIGVAKEKL